MLPLTLSLAVIIGSIFTMTVVERQRNKADADILTRLREHQQLQRSLVRLNADRTVAQLDGIKAGMDAVRLNLIESLILAKELPELMGLHYSLGIRRDHSSIPDYLRTALGFDAQHAESLLTVIMHLDKAASVWPHLLRGCAMQRQAASAGLSVRCFYDVYVWDVLS